jgi:hypothetical protein
MLNLISCYTIFLLCYDNLFKFVWIVVTVTESRQREFTNYVTQCRKWMFRCELTSTNVSIFPVAYELDLGSSSSFHLEEA